MGLGVASRQAAGYQVTTAVYEGPLDLLLQLIERAELDITKLALAQVTDGYLAHLREMQQMPDQENSLSAEEVSAFLLIAARLLQIKSEALLPRPPIRQPGEEDPGEMLAQQLLAYKRFRNAADRLSMRETSGFRTYLRIAPPPKTGKGSVDLSGVSLIDLVEAARSLFHRNDIRPSLNSVVTAPRVTIREKITLIAGFLRKKGKATFRAFLLGRQSRLDVVVTFLAMLELIKRHLIHARQECLFGDIEVETTFGWSENEEFDLEFGE
jgi:segregation and condensation protein A